MFLRLRSDIVGFQGNDNALVEAQGFGPSARDPISGLTQRRGLSSGSCRHLEVCSGQRPIVDPHVIDVPFTCGLIRPSWAATRN